MITASKALTKASSTGVTKDLRDFEDLKDRRECKVKQVTLDCPDYKDSLGLKDNQGHKDSLGHKDPRGLRGLKDHRGRRDREEREEQWTTELTFNRTFCLRVMISLLGA